MAIELLLVVPSLRQLQAVLRAYAADVRVVEVLLCAVDPRIGRLLHTIAGSLELLPFVGVQMLKAW